MQIDALAIRLRPRTPVEATDSGVRLCQASRHSVFRCYVPVALVVILLAFAASELGTWLTGLAVWLAKPWLDRTILFALSRAAFGQRTTLLDVWQAQRSVWWHQLLRTWTLQRLSPWRSFTQPIYQLEGLSGSQLRRRVLQIRAGRAGAATGMTSVFGSVELALTLALLSLLFWLAPRGYNLDLASWAVSGTPRSFDLAAAAVYALAVLFLEPFYVAAGFGLYLNRRAELEAWDIEQEFRRAFPG